MTLIKSILLGSAAGIVAVASAQAADLPTKKAAPVEQYVKICNVGGITGWTLPGSDTCVKLSGYITGQFVAGNLNTQYNQGGYASAYNALLTSSSITDPTLLGRLYNAAIASGATIGSNGLLTGGAASQRILIAGSQSQGNAVWNRPGTGFSTRSEIDLDFASNTAYGPLIGHFAGRWETASGLDPVDNNQAYLDQGYLTWAGITAGKAASFYSFTGGGDNWANIFSPDQKGFNEPVLFAYTASFGGGFSATLAAQSPGVNGPSGGGTQFAPPGGTFGGQRWPDIVGALHVTQGWGEAQVSGVLHQVNVAYNSFYGAGAVDGCGVGALVANCNYSTNKTGWGVDAGVKFNLPSFGAGDNILVTGSYTQNAVWYSGLPDGMWGENGQVNGNGQAMPLYDTYFNSLTNQWSSPTAWSVAAILEHHFTPQFYVDLEGSVGGLKWSNMGGGCYILGAGCGLAQAVQGPLSPSATSWIIGADLGWNPVTNLNFDLELMYQNTNQTKPSGFLGTVYNVGGVGGAVFAPGAWEGNSSGFAGRVRITRYF
jgi:hypothetical protein